MGVNGNRPYISIQLLIKHIPDARHLPFPPDRNVAIVAKMLPVRPIKGLEGCHDGLSGSERLNARPIPLINADHAPAGQVLPPLSHLTKTQWGLSVRGRGAEARPPAL